MSKQIKQKNGINDHFARKQTIDLMVILVIFIFVFAVVEYTDLSQILTAGVLVLLFCLTVVIFEATKKQYKKKATAAINNLLENAIENAKRIEGATSVQKENINLTFAKLSNIKLLIENLKNQSNDLNAIITNTKQKALDSLNYTNTEYDAVKANIEKMFTIRHKIQTIAELILELSDFIQSISSTIGLVEDIAEQTNLLALNAAVEAARAGEHGKGFAIVAGEIRKLADESKQATSKITSLITNIQQSANSTVLATEEGTKEVESGIELAHNIGSNIEQLILLMNEISQGINDMTGSSKKISTDTSTTENAISEINSMLENNYKATEENFQNIENIQTLSKTFKSNIDEE
ncbi:TPA: hypothetical protein IAA86_06920 [Candidatus Galligastranaerophilus intestinavium]|uniref:Methyl-accepting transducer domain-containing protein n=1 Tax=Candidatus Galligastranaerophilus intestinavium TaxID=2840836 RepID=A0A9D1FJ93_9BACT|nr:hypothetical protein [Candidatus Galligastranaerophilus intestinavium]